VANSGGVDNVHTHLVNAAKLEVYVQVLLVQRLQTGIEQTAQQRTLDLLHDLRTSLFGVMLCHRRA
jgi:hypothetical protein